MVRREHLDAAGETVVFVEKGAGGFLQPHLRPVGSGQGERHLGQGDVALDTAPAHALHAAVGLQTVAADRFCGGEPEKALGAGAPQHNVPLRINRHDRGVGKEFGEDLERVKWADA